MVPKMVLRHVSILRHGYVVVCLLAAAPGLMGQTTPSVIPTGSTPTALAINPATNLVHNTTATLTVE